MERIVFALLLIAGCNGSNGLAVKGDGGPGGGGMHGGGDGGSGPPPNPGLMNAKFGTYIALGDSISDNGGTGPFFYELLLQNVSQYPQYAGHDLMTKYPGIMYVHGAVAGAITDSYPNLSGAPTLKNQVTQLGHSYPGDVLVTITIGGNDLNGHSFDAIQMKDGTDRMNFDQHLKDELGELTMPGRLGQGHVYVILANIYDFSDGQGDFATIQCGPPFNIKASVDQMGFDNWNGIMQTDISAVGQTLYDMHADFMGHGYNNTNADQVWYDMASCIHPNATGHNQIRKSIWKLITGESF
jgi:lysophospholipase L1-like esterase